MDEEQRLNEFIGKTGLITVEYSTGPYELMARNLEGSLNLLYKNEIVRTLNKISRHLHKIMLKIIKDGRRYEFHSIGIEGWGNPKPPYDMWLRGRVSVGLKYSDDCEVGEYYLLKREFPRGEIWYSNFGDIQFIYEGDFLWKRIR